MQLYISITTIVIVVVVCVGSLWHRFKQDNDDGIEPWMLRVPNLEGICTDYLALIKDMHSGRHDRATIHTLDAQRQVTHDQILGYLALDRSSSLDVEAFAKRYLGWK